MEAFSLFLLWWLFGCGRDGGSSAPALPSGIPGGEPGWPGSPVTYTPPWPQQKPSGLPPFPGSGWEFDEPPPAAVQQRARQLVDVLWAQGSGAFRTEQTGGRWITYQAQVVASGRKGVVAYRQKRAQLPSGSAATASRARAPALPRATAPAPSAASSSRPPATSPGARASRPPAAAQPVSVRVGPAVMKPEPSAVSPVVMPVLQRGAGIKPKPPSPNVKLLQQRLGIKDDGQFWDDTEEAVRAFQAAHRLDVDGIVGPDTWTALFAGQRA